MLKYFADKTAFLRNIKAEDVENEFECLQEAMRISKEQLMLSRSKVAQEIGEVEATIFDAHIAILEDRALIGKIRDQVQQLLKPAEVVVSTIVDGYYDALRMVDDVHIRERAADIRDVGQRLLDNLAALRPDIGDEQQKSENKSAIKDIIFAKELFPSDIEQIAVEKVLGVICERGSDRGHVAVMLRAMGIPCVMGVDGLASHIHDGDFIIIDGSVGHVVINPRSDIITQYELSLKELEAYQVELKSEVALPSETKDGVEINLLCNVGHLAEMALGEMYAAKGVGLYRTEFELMSRSTYPDEDEQYQIYSDLVRSAKGQPITFRTMDIGSEKHLPYLPVPEEENHALGMRSIRLAIAHEEYQLIQLRAILRSAVHGTVRLMFPFITSVEDIRTAKRMVRQAMRSLRERKVDHSPRIPIGMMVEIPAVALSLDKFVREVEFFSIGTNDLTQYTCAADRNQKEVAQWYNSHNPGMLSLLKQIVDVANHYDREVTVCGEMAGEPMYTMFLLGIGVRELSMSAPQIPLVKKIIRSVDIAGAKNLADRALQLPTTERVGDLFNRTVEQILGRDIKRF
ncbi:MAG: phosphoenolpyruvate--protein phosphotransferase [Planctomycetes bacterium]|nr:phosphoenolpyruvate--protein phosphotransferase [Planctomycetota bacterium]